MGSVADGKHAFCESDWERYLWWGRAAAQGCGGARRGLVDAAITWQEHHDLNGQWHRIVFEIDAACGEHLDLEQNMVFGKLFNDRAVIAVARAVAFHDERCVYARQAIKCWIWVGRQKKIMKDIRGLIARLLWVQKATWIESCVRKRVRKSVRRRR